ncbi:hypothetical protein WS75_23705 [Burkholderia sp. FL-7-2-10-S1-D7]|uniref:hypothetical protein n=1 Tax=Burkholderia sp. FL-7-2-10-S1-D7 TaxID=1637866 RepID=UPI0007523511|nr:hypothetical protein [Burkholderia sp. FL-7-2-10-S1-D7]KVF70334.1 hypothetical protein WS75_23705 [Burkholderia sp. FL-7-2-10-S1-D7]
MAIECPPQYSVWENDKGGKIFVEDVFVDGNLFFVTVVPYAQRQDMNAVADELDSEQWTELIHVDGIRQTGIEPPSVD